MYNFTTDRDKIIEITRTCAEPRTKQIVWKLAIAKLNDFFNEQSGVNVWRKRYERAVSFVVDLEDKYEKEIKEALEQNSGVNQDVKSKIIALLKGGAKQLKELAYRAGVSEVETLGYLSLIENEGIVQLKKVNIGGYQQYAIDTTLRQDKQEYEHAVGVVNTKTFMVLSDSHMGSVNEQTSFIHYLYDLAVQRGIDTVYHCGDISEGFKRSRPAHIFSLHAISFDEQLEHIVSAYPQRDGITTYFITGNHDHFHIENGGANIGKGISAQRSDMVYLGINTAVIKLNDKCKMELFHPQDGSSYATSYAGQKYLDSLSGGDKPNILFVGHHHKSLYFQYRNVHYFEVPSTHSQSDWEKGKRIQNTSGAWIVTVDFDEEGTVTRIVPESIIQYKHIKNDWQQWKDLTK
jgi:predicted phosphodiesterase